MPLLDHDQSRPLSADLCAVFGAGHLVPHRHPNQRNHTWRYETARGAVVVKQYRSLSVEAVTGVLAAEDRVRAAGLPVPAVLHRSPDRPVVAYRWVDGIHLLPDTSPQIASCAKLFADQLEALHGLTPAWTPLRPARLPRRAGNALAACPDGQLAQIIQQSWDRLTRLAEHLPLVASHTDWRADNILFARNEVAAVLDWEDVVLIPAAEAVGYAAGSLTHSWREELYRPLALAPVTQFLASVADRLAWPDISLSRSHARLATLFTCGVRLAEDRQRGTAAISTTQLRAAFEG